MAKMLCIKTGCHLYSSEYQRYFRGDLYYRGPADAKAEGSRAYALRFVWEGSTPLESRVHCHVASLDLALGMHQVKKDGDMGVLLFEHATFFDYDGKTLKEATL